MRSPIWRIRQRGEQPGIFGRDRECAQLCELLDDAIAGHRSLVLISGEAGIAKISRPDDVIPSTTDAEHRDMSVGCDEPTSTSPCDPWLGAHESEPLQMQ
jgi:hypothetical protein